MASNYSPAVIGPGIGSMQQINNEFQKIKTAMDRLVSRYSDAPNAFQFPLDMGGQDILNVGKITATDLEVGGIDLAQQVTDAETAASEAAASAAEALDAEGDAQAYANAAKGYRDQALAAYNNILFLQIETESGSFSLDDSYTNKVIFVDSSSGVTCTIGGCSVGFQALIIQAGSGAVTFSSSDTILTRDGLTTTGEGAVASVIQYGASTVYLNGQLG